MPPPSETSNTPDSNARALAFLRIAVGIFFLIFGEYKVFGTQFTLHGGFEFWINKFLQEGGAYPFMVPVLRDFVLPHATSDRVPRRLQRIRDRSRVHLRHPCPTRKRRRLDLHADAAVFLRLPRRRRPLLAILRRQPGPLYLRVLLHRIPDRWTEYPLFNQRLTNQNNALTMYYGAVQNRTDCPPAESLF